MNFEKLTAYIDGLSRDMVPGIDMTVWQDHKPVYRHMAGYRDRENGIALNGKELYWAYSATKVFTCTAALQLFEKGLFGLDDPVGKYLPAYSVLAVEDGGVLRAPKKPMTIRNLFTMTGGLSYDIDTPSVQKALFYSGGKADTLTLVNAFAEEPLLFDPGEHFKYSLCHDVLAAVVEVISGERFCDYVKKHIMEPLGITRSGFHGENLAEFAVQYMYSDEKKRSDPAPQGMRNRYMITPNYDSGGAGMFTCVDDYIKLSDALACGGVGANGNRILMEPTVDLMRLPQLGEVQRNDFITSVTQVGPQYSYGLGVRTVASPELSPASPAGEFGWDGAANAYTLIDPANRLSVYVGMHILGFGPGYHIIHHDLRDITYECVRS